MTKASYKSVIAFLAASIRFTSCSIGISCICKGNKAGAVPRYWPSMERSMLSKKPKTCVENMTNSTMAKFLANSLRTQSPSVAILVRNSFIILFKNIDQEEQYRKRFHSSNGVLREATVLNGLKHRIDVF